MSDERRNFVRIGADCMIRFRRSDEADGQNGLSRDRYNPTASMETCHIASKIRANGDHREELILELLLWIDWKVNYLIKTLTDDREAALFPYEAYMIDLCGEGMRFSSYEQTSVGTKLQFRFFLPVIPFKEMILNGVVTRVRQKAFEDSSPPCFEMGVEFSDIKELDQESIFSYVAKRERQLLHERREQELEGYRS